MSWHNYLVLPEQKLLVDLGNHTREEDFLNEVDILKKIYDFKEECGDLVDTNDITLKNISIKSLSKLVEGYDYLIRLAAVESNWIPLAIAKYVEHPEKLEIIGEDKKEAYEKKGYRIL